MRGRTGPFLWLYRLASQGGLLDKPLARRAFESAYLAYKVLEAGPTAPLRALVAPGSTVIDVGANIGFFSLRFGRWVGPAGHVIAIEPEGRNMATLRRRVRRARLEEVIDCVEAAATDRAGEARLALNPVHPGDHHIAHAGQLVRTVTIDELSAGDPRRVSLIKIDVQGAEMMVINGALRLIEAHQPPIFMEVDDQALRRLGSSAGELIETLADLGYSGHLLTRRGVGVVAESSEALMAKRADAYTDVLFLPPTSR